MKAVKKTLPGHKTGDSPQTVFDDQRDCPIFARFPREIRDIIWDYALSLPDNSRTVHFHIYDHVYDCCTYTGSSTGTPPASMERTRATGLLRTCKAIYEEAVPLLYTQVRFELVLFSGRVRPDTPYETLGTNEDFWRHFKMGKIKSCSTFALMKDVTVILQPTLYLDSRQYEKRIASLLKALNFGQDTLKLCLKFNIPGTITDDTTAERWAASVMQAFMPLAQYHSPQAAALKYSQRTQLSISANTLDEVKYPRIRAGIEDLQSALNISEIVVYNPAAMFLDPQQKQANECLLHQHYHSCCFRPQRIAQPAAPVPQPPRSKPSRIVLYVLNGILWTSFCLAVPMVLPVLGVGKVAESAIKGVQRRRREGESWRMRMLAK